MKDVLLSIVIANYNYGRFLETAIRSVLCQNRNDVELIICDGGSTDNSVEIIQRYAKGLPPNTSYEEWQPKHTSQHATHNSQLLTWWCSEKDRGQSHAFNKGFAHARGRFLTWLNADDIMAPDAIAKLVLAIERHTKCEWFIGGCCWLDPELKIIRCTRARPLSKFRADGGDIQAYGPSSFFARSLFERVGGYVDEGFHFMMDTELWCRFYHRAHANYKMLPGYIWGFRMQPDSKTSGFRFKDSALSQSDNPMREKQRKEKAVHRSRYCTKPLTPWRRLLSVSWRLMLLGKLDTLRFSGKPFIEM